MSQTNPEPNNPNDPQSQTLWFTSDFLWDTPPPTPALDSKGKPLHPMERLTYTATGLPSRVRIDPTAGLISGYTAPDATRLSFTLTYTSTPPTNPNSD